MFKIIFAYEIKVLKPLMLFYLFRVGESKLRGKYQKPFDQVLSLLILKELWEVQI